jgi:AcrR family transcriptional regulator
VGVGAIVDRADVARMTLYNRFGSKDGLIADCLRMLDVRYHEWFVRQVASRADEPRARILAAFDVLGEWFCSSGFRGCAFINAAVELSDPAHPGHQAIVAHKGRTRGYLLELAEGAEMTEPQVLADSLMLLIEGAIVTALVEGDRDAAARGRRGAELLLAGLATA